MRLLPENIRVASWLGAECIDHYMRVHGIEDSRLRAFCSHIAALSEASDLAEWDAVAKDLEITGLGDPLPESLDSSELVDLIAAVREISASQMYGAFDSGQVSQFLGQSVSVSGLDLDRYDIEALCGIKASDGWGAPLDIKVLESYRNAV